MLARRTGGNWWALTACHRGSEGVRNLMPHTSASPAVVVAAAELAAAGGGGRQPFLVDGATVDSSGSDRRPYFSDGGAGIVAFAWKDRGSVRSMAVEGDFQGRLPFLCAAWGGLGVAQRMSAYRKLKGSTLIHTPVVPAGCSLCWEQLGTQTAGTSSALLPVPCTHSSWELNVGSVCTGAPHCCR